MGAWALTRTIFAGCGAVIIAAASIKPDDAISNLGGWADEVLGFAPTWLASPSADHWGVLIGLALLAVAIVARLAPRAVQKLSEQKWWEGKTRYSIPEAASALYGIPPSQYEKSEGAKALASDILGGVRNGHIRVADEAWKAENIGRILDPIPSKYPKKPDADFGTMIGKRALEALARNRSMKLPWKPKKTS